MLLFSHPMKYMNITGIDVARFLSFFDLIVADLQEESLELIKLSSTNKIR